MTSTGLSSLSGNVAGLRVSVEPEITRGSVITAFQNEITPFVNLINNDANVSKNGTTSGLTTDQLNAGVPTVQRSIVTLLQLAKNGLPVKLTPSDLNSQSVNFYLTQDMAASLDSLIKSLKLAGVNIDTTSNPPTVSLTGANLRTWLDIAQITPLVTDALGLAPVLDSHGNQKTSRTGAPILSSTVTQGSVTTFQADVELNFIGSANEFISNKMTNLQQALLTSQSLLGNLTDVQQLHNDVVPVSPPSFIPISNTATLLGVGNKRESHETNQVVDEFQNQESTIFARIPLAIQTSTAAKYSQLQGQLTQVNVQIKDVQAAVGRLNKELKTTNKTQKKEAQGSINTANSQLQQLQNQVFGILLQIKNLTPKLQAEQQVLFNKYDSIRSEISARVTALSIAYPTASTRPAILDNLKAVLKDMQANEGNKMAWFLDGAKPGTLSSTDQANVGKIQNNISFALASATTFNDTQKNNVKTFMYVFQQYYQAASAILINLSDTIEKIAKTTKSR